MNGLETLIKKLITVTSLIDYQVLDTRDWSACTSITDYTW